MGAGFGDLLSNYEKPYSMHPVNFASKSPLKNCENLKASYYWRFAEAARKTWETVQGIKKYSYQELISLPDDYELLQQFAGPMMKLSPSGKLQVESKTELKSRGIDSPDKAEAVLYSLYGAVDLAASFRMSGVKGGW